jgi:hypothetical protein
MAYQRYDDRHAKSSNPTEQRVPALKQLLGQLENTIENSDLSVEEIEKAVKSEIERHKKNHAPEVEKLEKWRSAETINELDRFSPKKDVDMVLVDHKIGEPLEIENEK